MCLAGNFRVIFKRRRNVVDWPVRLGMGSQERNCVMHKAFDFIPNSP